MMVVESKPARNKKKISSIVQSYDSDEEPMKVSNRVPLWRLPQEHSFSDWTIQISYRNDDGGSKEETKVDVYRVHKTILSNGPRQSLYFARLFSNEYVEHKTNQSSIELDKLAAKAFPQMLDYIYLPDSELVISTATAGALYHLGGYFEIRRLRWDAKQFWKKDISVTSCDTYFEHARIVCDDKIISTVREYCTNNIDQIEGSSRLLEVTDVDFWIRVLDSMDPQHSDDASQLISAHVMKNRGVSVEEFQKLTADRYLPKINAYVAIHLMDKERELMEQCNEPNELTSLQQRCIHSVGEMMILDCLDDELSEDDTSSLRKHNPVVLTSLLAACQKSAAKVLKHPRTSVTVKGAGTACVNGVYQFVCVVNFGHCYAKPIIWDKKPRLLLIQPGRNWAENWCITISLQGRPEPSDDNIDLYTTIHPDIYGEIIVRPPQTGWISTTEARFPGPTLGFESIDASIDV